jgi:hypothetical protein
MVSTWLTAPFVFVETTFRSADAVMAGMTFGGNGCYPFVLNAAETRNYYFEFEVAFY